MRSVSQARTLFLTIAVIFLVLDVAAVVLLLSPAGRSPASRAVEYEDLRREAIQKEFETRPTRDMDKKLVLAREEIGQFYDRHLPSNYADISEDLGKLASAQHILLAQVHYDTKATSVSGVNQVLMSLGTAGSYRNVMEFINGLERDKRFYVVDRVVIGDAGTNGDVRVEITVETYLKAGS